MSVLLKGNAFFIFDLSVVGVALIVDTTALIVVILCSFQLAGYRRFLISLSAGNCYTSLVNLFVLLHQLAASKYGNIQERDFEMAGAILRTLKLTGFALALLNLCGMSFDHYLGIFHAVKYRHVSKGGIGEGRV